MLIEAACPHVPAEMLTCDEPPAVPGETATQRDVALFVVDLDAAGNDCRRKLAAVRGLLLTGEGE